MKFGFLYGGQGSQIEGMGHDLYNKYSEIADFYDSLEEIKELSFFGSLEEISKTKVTQKILLAFQIAVTDLLKKHDITPDFCLGLSLGEYGALYGAGLLNQNDAMEIINFRSNEMANREKVVNSSMIAVISDDVEHLEKILEKVNTEDSRAEISGYNTKKQIVISGEEKAVEKAMDLLKEERIRVIPLNTSGPFHTSYMKPVEESLREYLKSYQFSPSEASVYSNVTGKVETENWDELLARQVSHPVRLKDSLEDLLTKDLDYIVEIGHKKTMAGFVKRLDRKVEVISLDDLESVEEFIKRIGEMNE